MPERPGAENVDEAERDQASALRTHLWDGHGAEELKTLWSAPAVHLLRVTDSTNDVARGLAADGAPAGTIVLAEEQRAGRGRLGRRWLSPPGSGFWCSLIIRPNASDELPTLPLRVALGVARSLDAWLDRPASIKWPNDVLVGGRKIGGVLCEAVWEAGQPKYVVAGVGVNLLQRSEDYPPELRDSAVSLRQVAHREVDRLEVATAVIGEVREIAESPSFMSRAGEISSRDATLGREVEVYEPETGRLIAAGRGAGIRDDGSLCVAAAEGEVIVRSGTVRAPLRGGGMEPWR